MEGTPLPRSKIRQKEIFDIFAMFALATELDKAERDMAERLSIIPGAVEKIDRIKEDLMELTEKILCTVHEDKLLNIKSSMHRMAYRVYLNAALPSYDADEIIIHQDDFDVLAQSAHDFKCLLCDEDCNRCALGKALDHCLLKQRDHSISWSEIEWNERND